MAAIKVLARGALIVAALLSAFSATSLGVWEAIDASFMLGHQALR